MPSSRSAPPRPPRTVLFLCTGNYYRSRFAAILFNHLARERSLPWSASSRGLKIGWPGNVGALSEHRQRGNPYGLVKVVIAKDERRRKELSLTNEGRMIMKELAGLLQ